MDKDTLVLFGTEVKAHDDGLMEGYLVKFGQPDLSMMRDVFTKDTDFDINPEGDYSTTYYHHGMDPVLKRQKLGAKARVGIDEVGVWIKHQLDLREPYEQAIHTLAKKGKLGWSSGVPAHLVERKAIEDDAHLVTLWPLGKDSSYTPIPADYRNDVMAGSTKSLAEIESMSLEDAIKSLLVANEPEAQTPEASIEAVGAAENGNYTTQKSNGVSVNMSREIQVMTDNQTQTPADGENNNTMQTELESLKSNQDALNGKVDKLSEGIDSVLKFMEDSPMMRKGGYFQETGGDNDPEVKSLGDLLISVQRGDEKRLKSIYGAIKAQSSASGPTGGFWIQEQTLIDLVGEISLVSGIGNLVRRIPVGSPSGRSVIRDYSRTPGGNGESATSAGVDGDGRAEGGSYGNETAYFEFVRYEVSDFCSGNLKASYELMQDVPQIESALRDLIQEDVANKEEYAILRGNGAGQPLGVIPWAGAITVDEATQDTWAAGDLDNMFSRLLRSGNARIATVYHPYAYADVAAMNRSNILAMHNIKDALPGTLNGYPHFTSQHLVAPGADNYAVTGDWYQYALFEYGMVYIRYTDQRHIDTGQVAWYFGKRIDGRPVMTSALTLADGSSTLSPFVVLNRG